MCIGGRGSVGNTCLVKSPKQSAQESCSFREAVFRIALSANIQITSLGTLAVELVRLSEDELQLRCRFQAQRGTWFCAILLIQSGSQTPPPPFLLLLPFFLHKYSPLAKNQLLVLNKETLTESLRLSHYAHGPPRCHGARGHALARSRLTVDTLKQQKQQ